jgi:hypothetical protein
MFFTQVLKLDKPIGCTQSIVELYDWNEFLKYARRAPLLIYEPEFFPTPFLHEEKIRCVNCYAIGIKFENLPVILKYQKNQKGLQYRDRAEPENPKNIIDAAMRRFIHKITISLNAVKGKLNGGQEKFTWGDLV